MKYATPKLRHCFYCGAPLGTYADWEPLDHCGALDCQREAQDAHRAMRDEAREKLDRDMGY